MKVFSKLFGGIETEPRDIEPGDVYAITGGAYLGEFFVYVEQTGSEYCFLSLPKMEVRVITQDKLKVGLTDKVMDLVEVLPEDVFEICIAQYRKAKDNQ